VTRYAVLWSQGDETPRAGSIELGGGEALLSARGVRTVHLPYRDLSAVSIARLPDAAGQAVQLVRRFGETVRVRSLEGAGVLFELADRLETLRSAA
jgi:hypothetical protein